MMRWRAGSSMDPPGIASNSNNSDGKPNQSSLDEDEPDSSSQDPTGTTTSNEAATLPDNKHGRLGDEDFHASEEEKKSAKQLDDDGTDHADNTPNIPWRPQNTVSNCEFTHVIADYAQKRELGCKKAEYSSTTVDDFGNRWRLIVYVNGNGRASNHHLSLFLQVADADDLPFGWKKGVSYVLTLEHPDGGSLCYAKRNPDKTFKLCPKAIDWGWSQFITSDRIQQEGFIVNDSLTVRASVTVKSSSVSIDEEDSELYLKCAVEEGDAEAVKLCLEHGASVNCKFKDDLYTPLHTACSSNSGTMQVLNLLLEQGADGNACNKWRETPLLIAANNGHRPAVEALLEHGTDPSLCSEAGWSALTFAAHKGFHDIAALLICAGAPVNCRVTEDSSTPLHKACAGSKKGHLDAVKLLLGTGADVHALNKWRETPLLTAANHGQAEAVEALLGAGADPCKCTDTGWSPLSIAAYKGHDVVVRMLLEEGAPTEEDDPTLSALLQAATKGLPDTVELLLQHGADHTVTTKKGDTALSILVEQNLIDSAVDMVTRYNANIQRCSRDRKKVQRARLLIQLRMKQQDREAQNVSSSTVSEFTDADFEEAIVAQHEVGNDSPVSTSSNTRMNRKGKVPKAAAEAQAKKAEEALLKELEEEETKAKKEEAEANNKRAKKKKKKEIERQQKLKEEQEKREKEEAEELVRANQRAEREERERIQREQRMHEKQELELREAMEREKVSLAKRREKERWEKEQKQKDNKPATVLSNRRKEQVAGPTSPTGSVSSVEKHGSVVKAEQPTGKEANGSFSEISNGLNASLPAGVGSLVGNRRWETAARQEGSATNASTNIRTVHTTMMQRSIPHPQMQSRWLASRSESVQHILLDRSTVGQSSQVHEDISRSFSSGESRSTGLNSQDYFAGSRNGSSSASNGVVHNNSRSSFVSAAAIEHPAVALFRREKVKELIRRCAVSLPVLDEASVKRALFRWVLRAQYGHSSCTDPLIPSWKDIEQLAQFFQRQFISESRRGQSLASLVNMEDLKEAGTTVALCCDIMAKDLLECRHKFEGSLSADWTDVSLGMIVSQGVHQGSITISWAARARVDLSASTVASMRDRFVGEPERFLTAVFSAKLLHDCKCLMAADTSMGFSLPSPTMALLVREAGVTAQLYTEPFSTPSSCVYWGLFEAVDSLFGGRKPFGTDQHGEEVLARHGGSVAALVPADSVIASHYLQRMLDLLDSTSLSNVPLSFCVFLHSDSFPDLSVEPSSKDLLQFDSRLGSGSKYLRCVEMLQAGHHGFCSAGGDRTIEAVHSSSLFVFLQNESSRQHFEMSEALLRGITTSLLPRTAHPPMSAIGRSVSTPASFRATPSSQSGYFDDMGLPFMAPQSPQPISPAFVGISGTPISETFSSAHQINSGSISRRGRLFDLIDDDDDEQMEVDAVSGMLNNLGAGIFQSQGNLASDVDIEAISLMGIGGGTLQSLPRSNSHSGHFRLL